MKVLCDFNLIPIGSEVSISKYIAECVKIFRKHNLKTNIHSLGSNIEGDWDTVMVAIKECHITLHDKMDILRIISNIKLTTRVDKEQNIQEKIDAISKHL